MHERHLQAAECLDDRFRSAGLPFRLSGIAAVRYGAEQRHAQRFEILAPSDHRSQMLGEERAATPQ